MSHLSPAETTHWCVYDSGLDTLHTGVTEPGQVTSTIAGAIEIDEDALIRLEVHKAKLEEPIEEDTQPPYPGFFLCCCCNRVVLLREEDCVGKTTLYEAVRDREEETR
jgi:hypothetical protein